MKRAAVIGHPVAHSLSPKLHGFWLNQYGIEGEYTAFDVKPQDFEIYLTLLPSKGFAGCNLTLPHKETALPLMDVLDPLAEKVGAVNTIVFKDGKTHGYNTDVYGFTENLKSSIDLNPYKKHAVVLGAGGAARAVVAGLMEEGFREITIVNRSLEKARDIVSDYQGPVHFAEWNDRAALLKETTLLVNTTSLGMKNQPPLDLALDNLSRDALVTDIVYNPLVTPLLAEARARGNKTVDGIGMLLHQAVQGFEMWFGKKPEVTVELREHVLRGIG